MFRRVLSEKSVGDSSGKLSLSSPLGLDESNSQNIMDGIHPKKIHSNACFFFSLEMEAEIQAGSGWYSAGL